MPSAQKGFTLVEVLLVIVILLMVTAISIPSFTQSFAQLQLKDAANDLAYRMRYAQSRAIYTQRSLKLMFDNPVTRYWLEESSAEDEEANEEAAKKYEPVAGRLGRVTQVPDDITIEAVPAIVFTPDGKIEKTQINICQKETCLIISTQNQSGTIVVEEAETEE